MPGTSKKKMYSLGASKCQPECWIHLCSRYRSRELEETWTSQWPLGNSAGGSPPLRTHSNPHLGSFFTNDSESAEYNLWNIQEKVYFSNPLAMKRSKVEIWWRNTGEVERFGDPLEIQACMLEFFSITGIWAICFLGKLQRKQRAKMGAEINRTKWRKMKFSFRRGTWKRFLHEESCLIRAGKRLIEREIAATDSDCLVGEKLWDINNQRVESSREMERRATNRLEQSRGFQHIDRGNWRIVTLHVFL